MNIESISSLFSTQQAGGVGHSGPGAMPPPPPTGQGDSGDISISSMGQVLSQFSQLSDEERSEIGEYLKGVMEAKQDGSFDAAALAEEAPESLKSLAEESGTELSDLLTQLSEQPPSPPPMGMMGPPPGNLSSEDQEQMDAFLQKVKEAKESGSFDAEALAEEAPEALTSLAEARGMEVTDLITEMASREPPPKGPMGGDGAGAYARNGEQEDPLASLLRELMKKEG